MDTTESGDVTLARAAFAEALRVEMARAGIHQKRELERLTRLDGSAGISEQTIGKYWRGEQTPRWTEQVQLAKALGIEVVDLIATAVAVYERLKAEASAGDRH
jgi:transcriptional regulator with XRE-family HTH domain